MANKSDKRIATDNAALLNLLKFGFLLTHALQIVCFVLFSSQRTRSHITLYVLTSLPSLFLYQQLYSMGCPRFGPTGQLIRAGEDLSQAGLTQYMQDIVFLTWAAQLLGLVSSKAWWIYATVPVFAAYKIAKIVAPHLFKARDASAADPAAGRTQPANKEGLSKRQMKMQARYEKGDRRYQMIQKEVAR